MISKEELEKLIEEKATIYYRGRGYKLENKEEHYTDFWYKQLFEITENGLHYIYENADYYEGEDTIFKFKDLYKTKEDAEFALKYTNIKRPEILNLPTWEEIQNTHFYEFWNKEFDYMLQYQPVSKKIAVYDMNNRGDYYLQDATKENYIKACDLCVKLFKGEEV